MYKGKARIAAALACGLAATACSHTAPVADPRDQIEAYVEATLTGQTPASLERKVHLKTYGTTYDAMLRAADEADFRSAFREMPKMEACVFAQFGSQAFGHVKAIERIATVGPLRRGNQERYLAAMQNTPPYRMTLENDPCS